MISPVCVSSTPPPLEPLLSTRLPEEHATEGTHPVGEKQSRSFSYVSMDF